MKYKAIISAVALTFSVPAYADVADTFKERLRSKAFEAVFGDANAMSPMLVDLPIEGAFSYFPSTDAGDFTLAEAYGDLGVNLGCNGVTLDGSIDAMINQYSSIARQFVANAPMIAVNYLVYSQPSLYSLIQNLKESTEFMLDVTSFTCQGARQLAMSNWEDSLGEKAAAECISSNGAATAACSDGDSLVDRANRLVTERKKQWAKKVADAKEALSKASVRDAMGNLVKSGESCDALNDDDEEVTANDLTLALSGLGCSDIELAKSLLPDTVIESDVEKGAKRQVPASLTVEKALADESIKVAKALDQLADKNTSDARSRAAYETLAEAGANSDLTLKQIAMLKTVKDEADDVTYQAYLTQVAVVMSRNRLSNIVDRLEIGLLNGMLNKDQATLGTDIEEQTKDKIRLLKAQIDTIDRMIAGQQRELELLNQAGALTSRRGLPY